MEDDKKVISELHVNFLGKLMLAAIGAWLVGRATNIKLRGTKAEIAALSNAMISSKKFQDELGKPGATVQSVMDKLNVKNLSASEFERVFNVRWPL